MVSQEIINILEKYQTENVKEINNINTDIKNVVNELKSVRKNLSKQLQTLTDCEEIDEKEDELLQDSKTLRKYISILKQISDNIDAMIDANSFDINSHLDKNKKVRLYLCKDNICPICNCNMEEKTITYIYSSKKYNIISGKRRISSFVCPCCYKYFVTDTEMENINLDETNIELLYNYYQEIIPSINIYSLIVLSNTLKCSLNHKTQDIIAKLPIINENGELSYVKINASYCFNCKRFTILKSDFANIKDIILCEVIDKTINVNDTNYNFDFEQGKSILFNYGYNVQTKSNLSDRQRQTILSSIIEAKIMDRRDIINHISILIERGSKIPSWNIATQKWKQDKEFVSNYKIGELPRVIFDNVILKYCK